MRRRKKRRKTFWTKKSNRLDEQWVTGRNIVGRGHGVVMAANDGRKVRE